MSNTFIIYPALFLATCFLVSLIMNLRTADTAGAVGFYEQARARARGVAFTAVCKDALALPFYAPGWVLGRLWWLLRFVLGAAVVGFVKGAEM